MWADELETLNHMRKMCQQFGKLRLSTWRTDDDKYISVLVLDVLATKGAIRRVVPPDLNMWTTPEYYLIIPSEDFS